MRSLLIFLAALVLIVLGLWATLVLYFDEERLKQIATEQVRAQTGRELSIDGELALDLLPGISIVARNVTLSGPDDYSGPDLFTADEFRMSVALLPLLSGNVETGDISLDRAEVNLHTDARGTSSLAGLLDAPASDAPEGEGGSVSTERISLSGIRLVISDAAADSRQVFVVDTLNVDSFRYDEPVPFEFAGSIGEPPIVTGIDLAGEVTVPSGDGAIQIARLRLDGSTSGLDFGLSGSAEVLPGPPLVARFMDGRLTLGEDRFSTAFSFIDGERPKIEATLEGQMLDVDALLPEASGDKPGSGGEPGAGTGAETESPLALLRDVDLEAELALEAMRVSGLTLRGVRTRVEADRGLLVADPIAAELNGGRFDATASIDLNAEPPRLTLAPVFELKSVGEALSAWGLGRYLGGSGGIEMDLTARGLDAGSILGSLDGAGRYDLRDGVVHGVDLNAMVEGLEGRNVAQAVRAGAGGTTRFESLSGPLEIRDGTIRLPGMRLVTELLGVTGDVRIGLADLGLAGRVQFRSERLGEIPIDLGGTLTAPQLAPDVGEALKREAGRRVMDLLRERSRDEAEEDDGGG